MKNIKKLILGIDTGGTFTDGVVIRAADDRVLAKTKVATTKEDLSIGIINCIRELHLSNFPYPVSLVCLSTTLATNAVVEEKISRVGLITTGSRDLKQSFTVEEWRKVSGEINILGQVVEDIDRKEVTDAVKSMAEKIDSLVISGYACVRNPQHEIWIKQIAEKHLSVPIICAHELSGSLGFNERTATAILNAHLMPLIDELVRKTKYALRKMGIDAQLAVVKGDGTMMLQNHALERPVETILSGPAASSIGGAYLTNVQDAYIIDLGGTTMDVANMSKGRVAVVDDGAQIQGRKTKVKAVDVRTFGLGGDSRLYYGKSAFSFGPLKAIPVCRAASSHPYLVSEFEQMGNERFYIPSKFLDTEGLQLANCCDKVTLNSMEQKIVDKLRDGPHLFPYILKDLTTGERGIGVESLLRKNLVELISMTPTDLLHIRGEWVLWDASASVACMKRLSRKANMEPEALTDKLITLFADQLTAAMIKSAFAFEQNYDSEIMESKWFHNAIFNRTNMVGLTCRLNKPIIGLGAPAKAWLGRMREPFHELLLLPEHSEVANAVGAAKGWVGEQVEILIRHNQKLAAYNVYLPWEMSDVQEFEDAKSDAIKKAKKKIENRMAQMDIVEYQITTQEKKKYLSTNPDGEDFIYDCEITVMASGKPSCIL